MKKGTIVFIGGLLLLISQLAIAQHIYNPIQKLILLHDTLYWRSPQLKAAGKISFEQWVSGDAFKAYFQTDKQVDFILSNGNDELIFQTPSNPVKTMYPLDLLLGNASKQMLVVFTPPFKPAFSARYKEKKVGAIIVENHPVYELVNIVFALTQEGSKDASTFDLKDDYYQQVVAYFTPYLTHPLLKQANDLYKQGGATYRMVRESSYNYAFHKDNIVVRGPYENFEEGESLMDEIRLWEDFAQTTRFQQFYAAHQPLYNQMVEEAKAYLPIKQMWKWCESRFPNQYQTYRIVISPMINGFHSTQHITSPDFNECVMFICKAGLIKGKFTKKEKEGMYSGVVFTEIDHNYVNPISDKYRQELDKVFGAGRWIQEGTQASGYGSGTEYFNEYLTHALYLLYIADHYSRAEFTTISNERFMLMHNRGFIRFKEFYDQLAILCENRNYRKNIPATYPQLIEWAKAK